MVAQVLPFFRRLEPHVRDWTQQEIAEFYRVESALLQAGVRLECDRGLTDEGDPWFIFCRADTGDVFIHFARIDGQYVVDGAAFERPARGPDFLELVRSLIERYPLAKVRERGGSNIFVHPAALLIALVGAAFFHSNDAKAADSGDKGEAQPRRSSLISATSSLVTALPGAAGPSSVDLAAQAAAVILSAVLVLESDLFSLVRQSSVAATIASLEVRSGLTQAPAPSAIGAFGAREASPSAGEAEVLASKQVLSPTVEPSLPAAQRLESEALDQLADRFDPHAAIADAPAPFREAAASDANPTSSAAMASGAAVLALTLTDAIEAVSGAGSISLAAFQQMMRGLLPMEQVPPALLELIRLGEHLHLGALAQPPSPAEPSPAPPVLPAASGAAESLDPAPPYPAPPPSDSLPPKLAHKEPAVPTLGHNPAIDAAIREFIAQVEKLKVIVEGANVILFDQEIFDPGATYQNLTSITFTFGDGSTVSLVGTAEDLAHLSWAV